MTDNKQPGDIAPLVREWLPDAREEELIAATANFRRYIEVLYRIFRRLETEGRFPLTRDKGDDRARLKLSNQSEE